MFLGFRMMSKIEATTNKNIDHETALKIFLQVF